MRQLAIDGKMGDRGEEFLTLLADHKEVHKCKI
jgi:N-acetyl-gamma-glutamylphosphate reductase